MLVVFHQFAQHLARRHIAPRCCPGWSAICVIWPIERSVVPPSLRTRSASWSVVRENRVGLLVEHQMIVAEMPAADMPVEILGLQIEREGVGQQRVERGRNLVERGLRQIGRGIEIGDDGLLSDLALLTMDLPVRKPDIGRQWTWAAGPFNASMRLRFRRPEPVLPDYCDTWTTGSIITIPRIRFMRADCIATCISS